MSITPDVQRGELTLGFELAAMRALAHPNTVVEDAQQWSRYVGVIAVDTDDVRSYLHEHELNLDFDSGNRDKWLALKEIREKTNTDRHVFIGHSEDDRRAAERTGWEFLFAQDAAEKTGWTLSKQSSLWSRIRSMLCSQF